MSEVDLQNMKEGPTQELYDVFIISIKALYDTPGVIVRYSIAVKGSHLDTN